MAEIVPVDQFLDWYPGWKPEHIDDPWLRMRSGPFRKEDESRFWFVDFHWPRGFSPLGFSIVSSAAWGTQLAAHQLPLPPAGGLVQRMGGPFLYESEVPVTSQWEIGYRAARIEKNMPRFLGNFDAIWEERKWELELGLGYFESYDFDGKSLADIGQYIADARTFNNRAWEIHFEIMYPLLAIYLQLYGLCAGNGIDPGNIAKMLQGRDSKIMETDRAMWDLADEAKRLGIADHFEHEPDQIREALSKAGGNASIWLTKFDDFLKVHGWRTEGIVDINIPSWIEDQSSPLGQLRNFVQMEHRHDFDKSLVDSHRERDEAIDAARSQLNGDDLAGFNELLGICTVANFAWWNEDHNYYIDLRSAIPLRRGALAAAEAVGADTFDDTTFLFYPELQEVCRGDVAWKDKQSIATARHEYYDHYQGLRGDDTEGRRNAARQDRRPGADRDLRHAQPLLRGPQVRRPRDEVERIPGFGGCLHRPGAGDGVGHGTVRSRGGRDPRHRGHVAQLDPGVCHHRRLRLRRRRIVDSCRNGQQGVRNPMRRRHVGGNAANQDRRSHRGRRIPGCRHHRGARLDVSVTR